MKYAAKKYGKSKNYSSYGGIIALIVIVLFVILITTVLFKIDSIVIKGSSIYTKDEIAAASGIESGDNLIRTNMGSASNKISEQLIYIEDVKVKRVFPSAVEITVTPSVKSVNVPYEDTCYILSQSGKILEISNTPVPDILTIEGVSPVEGLIIGDQFECAEKSRNDVFYKLKDIGQHAMDGKINYFDMSNHLSISSIYENRITIEFGAISEFDYKLELAETIISTKIGPETVGTLSMTSNGARFIDKEGLEQNEQTYLNNINTSISTENSDEISHSDNSVTNSDSTQTVHFE